MNANKLIKVWNKWKITRSIISKILERKTIYIPRKVEIGKRVSLVHNAPCLVVHPNTVIGDDVKIYQGVTIGRADIYRDHEESDMEKIIIDDGAVICAGAKILCKEGVLRVGKNTIVGANAVLTRSTGDNEIWAGIPAKRIKIINNKEKTK